MLTLIYEYKLKPTKQQTEEMEHILEVCRSVWNYALRERKDWSASRKCPINACSLRSEYILPADAPYPNFAVQCKALTQAKKENFRLSSVNAQVLQQVLKTLERAHADMQKKGLGYPRFKKPNRMRSFVFPQLGKSALGDGVVKLPSLR
jgi:putative transposase